MYVGGAVNSIMMQQIKLKVKAADGQRLHSNWGYALYGVLSSVADTTFVGDWHSRNDTPFSQYLEVLAGGTEAIWHIHLLGEEVIQNMSTVLQQQNSFAALHHNTTLEVLEQQWEPPLPEVTFCQQYLTERSAQRHITIELLTPASFKSQEQYQIFPTEELIIKSLWLSWQNYAQEVLLDGDDVREQLMQHVHITDYRLKSVRYPVKGSKIPSFQGKLKFYIAGPEPLVRLVNLLFAFGEYRGLGIKTALGMGGYRLL